MSSGWGELWSSWTARQCKERAKRISKNSFWSGQQRDIVFAIRDHGHSKKTRTAELPNWVL